MITYIPADLIPKLSALEITVLRNSAMFARQVTLAELVEKSYLSIGPKTYFNTANQRYNGVIARMFWKRIMSNNVVL
jgi:hypothetical protein